MRVNKQKIFLGGIIFLSLFVSVIFLFFNTGQKKELIIGKSTTPFSHKAKETNLKENLKGKVVLNENKKVNNLKGLNSTLSKKDTSNQRQDKKRKEEIQKNSASLVAQIETPKIINHLVGWGFKKSVGRKIDTIIIHSSYNVTSNEEHNLEDIINKEYRPAGVSPHYIISREGKIYRLVKDKNIAYHAGVSKMPDGRVGVNNFSLGIEIVETKTESPTNDQYEALKKLISYLKEKYAIKYILGHSDIAPGRKTDPWNFDWKKIGLKSKN